MTLAFQTSRGTAPPIVTGWPGRLAVLARDPAQLIGALLLGVALPAMIFALLGHADLQIDRIEHTALACLVATVVGAFVLHRVAVYPHVRPFSMVSVGFTTLFVATAVVLNVLETDYSPAQFAVTFLFVVSWFYFVLDFRRQVLRPRMLLLPVGGNAAAAQAERSEDLALITAPSIDLGAPSDGDQPVDWVMALSASEMPAGISGVVADLRSDLPSPWEQFLTQCALSGVPVYHSKAFAESITGRVEIEHSSENNLSSLVASSPYSRVKRLLDIAVALLAAPFASLIGLVVAVAIKLDDGGPVFFRQVRMGYRGKTFTIIKFRTMRPDSDSNEHFTQAGDPRITRVGRYLRQYRIDELPQIINVLRSEMSWIGPRPEALLLSQWYESKISFYAYRHIVRPGISGWAQVNQGNVAEIEAATKKLHYDFYYLKYFSPWLDLLIAARTVRIVLTRFGAR